MPTYYSRMTAVQLAVADLPTTTTSDPQTRPYPGVYDEISDCAAEFAKASTNGTLDETPVPTEDDNRSHVRFIGTSGDMPFFMVQAGRGFFDMDQQEKRNRRPFRVPPSVINLVSAAHLSAISHKEKAQGAKEPPGSQGGQNMPQTSEYFHSCPDLTSIQITNASFARFDHLPRCHHVTFRMHFSSAYFSLEPLSFPHMSNILERQSSMMSR